MTTRSKPTQPTDEQRDRAAAFATWQTRARQLKGWNIPYLSKATGYSDSQVRLYDSEGRSGIDAEGVYRQPGDDYIKAVAEKTGADAIAGMVAAGRVLVIREGSSDYELIAPEVITLREGTRLRLLGREGDPGTVLEVDATALAILEALANKGKKSD